MKKVGLVLSGGGALGAAHVGVVEHLEQLDYQVEYIAGVSAGSIIGALIATGRNSDDIYHIFERSK